jgi:hypothetical protein
MPSSCTKPAEQAVLEESLACEAAFARRRSSFARTGVTPDVNPWSHTSCDEP